MRKERSICLYTERIFLLQGLKGKKNFFFALSLPIKTYFNPFNTETPVQNYQIIFRDYGLL